MTDFDAIDALLAGAKPEVPLPPVEERRALREHLNLSRAQVAQVLGVSPSTVGGWESGRDPGGEVREKYAYFLDGARARRQAQAAEEAAITVQDAGSPAEAEDVETASVAPVGDGGGDGDADEVEVLTSPQPCVLCGRPARHQVAGFPQHLDPADCGRTAATPPARAAEPEGGRPDIEPDPEPERPASRKPTPESVAVRPVGRRMQAASDTPDLIGQAVAAALAQHQGDVDTATAALVKRAIPDAMALLDATRRGGRYDVVAHPWIPDILRKQSARGADQIWEARPKWFRPQLPPGNHEVTALDINGAYLSALKTHLPIGQLEHSTGPGHDRRRAGVHLITPPGWEHEDVLPNPIGNRDEPGPLWVTEPTLRLLLRLSGPKYGLCDPPEIHESFTSGATEGLLEKFRVALKDARDRAIVDGDEVTLEYVKAMYSKFVSTMGESNYNRELYRPDWMHLIRSQAFANLWMKAYKAYDEGLTVVRAMGTDELHVIGDWRGVFAEGRGVTEVKVKDTYTVGSEENQER
ncbi:helix-turn-helix domain-containing protein [Streptomyces resistomycificus]|uniref:Dihydrolipoamide succinyltransferase n=1 Tax=Streptomyces resistomycificus TaxID=67356 RepID=A0A0L8KZW5_9ACTN|nr:helix-turn-helix transcriptional regulator [Streptomyces resistomycificus]KOG31376.1 dihydrolipoamide succinyltransferase [Streptomyces resistomycificus]KUN94271.1 dihydrolipoamide succinyltransferase [Streptomyces resistomycificus]